MLGVADTATVTFDIRGIDIIALKKLSLVSHALAQKIGGSAGQEQQVLATVLDDTIRKIEPNSPHSAQRRACAHDRQVPHLRSGHQSLAPRRGCALHLRLGHSGVSLGDGHRHGA